MFIEAPSSPESGAGLVGLWDGGCLDFAFSVILRNMNVTVLWNVIKM